jgi:hypothetical protein
LDVIPYSSWLQLKQGLSWCSCGHGQVCPLRSCPAAAVIRSVDSISSFFLRCCFLFSSSYCSSFVLLKILKVTSTSSKIGAWGSSYDFWSLCQTSRANWELSISKYRFPFGSVHAKVSVLSKDVR